MKSQHYFGCLNVICNIRGFLLKKGFCCNRNNCFAGNTGSDKVVVFILYFPKVLSANVLKYLLLDYLFGSVLNNGIEWYKNGWHTVLVQFSEKSHSWLPENRTLPINILIPLPWEPFFTFFFDCNYDRNIRYLLLYSLGVWYFYKSNSSAWIRAVLESKAYSGSFKDQIICGCQTGLDVNGSIWQSD